MSAVVLLTSASFSVPSVLLAALVLRPSALGLPRAGVEGAVVEDVLEGAVPEDVVVEGVLDSRAVEGRVVVGGVLEGRAMEGRAVEGRGGSTDLGRILRSTVHRRIPAAILARQGSLKEAHVKLGLVARLHHTGCFF